MGLDFINRVIKTTLLLGALIFVFGSYYFDWTYSLGIFTGVLWGCANLWFIRQFIVNYLTTGDRNAGKLALFALIKFPILYGAGFLILWLGWFPVVSFVMGFSLIFLVVVFKALGLLITEGGFKNFNLSEKRVEG
ncbi:MAG: hypothetical protein GWO41_16675 [candidate division Zixibacteria bacterium]|nr:hypothetical protein [candidate division Zixibacteria bacterium]NIS47993.1 hypothetical protein [candidate division Zixibacteria bacterium]NIT54327.1 hypothetical protein [candidate division Zixibacteria bacterium]NIW42833.1 hypothetical protein [candidate division Zixibacteria bacterium]NIX58461.1 hypothetical protein [candidate division Zixibacteria bacterium]